MNTKTLYSQQEFESAINDYITTELKYKPLRDTYFIKPNQNGRVKLYSLKGNEQAAMLMWRGRREYPLVTIVNHHANRGENRKTFDAWDFRIDKTPKSEFVSLSQSIYFKNKLLDDYADDILNDCHLYQYRNDQALVIKYKSIDGELDSTQTIMQDGKKKWVAGAKTKGLFYEIKAKDAKAKVASDSDKPAILCEGIATAMTIWLSFGGLRNVVSVGGCGNMENILRHRPNSSIALDYDIVKGNFTF